MVRRGKRESVREAMMRLRYYRPRARKHLAGYVRAFLGMTVPDQRLCPDHDSPLDYLAWALQIKSKNEKGKSEETVCGVQPTGEMCGAQPQLTEEAAGERESGAIVWANRGGGKTQLGAIASLLDCVFRPGCQVRILGGSERQSQQMYRCLRGLFERGFGSEIDGAITQRGCRFLNGADVQVLTQSDRSVRGQHVQRLRCDEVELFDRDVWQAAQFVTHSTPELPGRLEVFSTMHRPSGLMHEIVSNAAANRMRLFRWCLWEVIEQCRDRVCSRCPLWGDCGGRAKNAAGYYPIDDAVAQKQRSSAAAWQAEMLCQRPGHDDAVFAEFNPAVHVQPVGYEADLPLYRTIDFGYSNPLVCLFIQIDELGRVRVIDEHLKSRTTLSEHARLITQRYPYRVEATYGDPAGRQRHEITGTSAAAELAALGITVQSRPSGVLDGIEQIRRYLAPADGPTKLIIAPRCEYLIRAFSGLHYERLGSGAMSEHPDKDGVHDHLIDALRYFFVNRFSPKFSVREARY